LDEKHPFLPNDGGTMLTLRPGNKGRRYPADPPRVEEIVAVMKAAGDRP
jgi:hypothetical protein